MCWSTVLLHCAAEWLMRGCEAFPTFFATFWAPWPISEMTLTTLTTAGTTPPPPPLPLLDCWLITNSSDSFTNLEFRIYDFFLRILSIMISFSTGKLRIKTCFEPRSSSLSAAQTEKNSWKKSRETNW